MSNRASVSKTLGEILIYLNACADEQKAACHFSGDPDDASQLAAQLSEALPGRHIAKTLISNALGGAIEGCVSEGCSGDKPCSYCREAQDAIKALEKL
jgi:hypothetical protein